MLRMDNTGATRSDCTSKHSIAAMQQRITFTPDIRRSACYLQYLALHHSNTTVHLTAYGPANTQPTLVPHFNPSSPLRPLYTPFSAPNLHARLDMTSSISEIRHSAQLPALWNGSGAADRGRSDGRM